MRVVLIFAAMLASGAAYADGYCNEPYDEFFACDIPERGARVEFCRVLDRAQITDQTPEYRYSYAENGVVQLSFDTANAMSTAASGIRGIWGDALTTGFDNAGTIYAAYIPVEADYPSEAVVMVYPSMDDYIKGEEGTVLARRYCYPPSIDVNMEWFGPG